MNYIKRLEKENADLKQKLNEINEEMLHLGTYLSLPNQVATRPIMEKTHYNITQILGRYDCSGR